MTASAKYLDSTLNFRAETPGTADVPTESRRITSLKASPKHIGRLVGAGGLYTLFVGGLLWSQPAWIVVFAPLVHLGVSRSLFSYFGGDERRHLTGR